MKLIQILRFYLKGVRLAVLVLVCMMTWVMVCGMIAFGKVQHIRAGADALSGADIQNTYMLVYFPNSKDIETDADSRYAQAVEAQLEAHDAVEQVFAVRVVNRITYDGDRISIVLYEPEMLEFFPGLKEMGIDFSDCPDGCILGSQRFNALDEGDNIDLKISKTNVSVPVAGHVRSPYRHMTLSVSGNIMVAGDLFKDGDAILMQATDNVMAQINAYAKSITYDCNLIVDFKENTSEAEREAVLREMASEYLYFPFESVLENSEDRIAKTLKQELPLPLFLAFTSMVAFFSITVLTFDKKRRDTALLYLCGCSRRKCAAIVFTVFQLFSLIPVILNVLFVQIWPSIEWKQFTVLKYADNEALFIFLLKMRTFFSSITVSNDCLIVVFWYYIAAMLISLIVTVSFMARHTPVTYLRGVSE